MILYQIYHPAGWAWVITHKLTVAKEKEAILLVADNNDTTLGYNRNFDEYVNLGIFTRVVQFDGAISGKIKTESEIEKTILDSYDVFFAQNAIDLYELEAIYSSADSVHSFGIYLSLKRIHYYFFELAYNHLHKRTTFKAGWLYQRLLVKHGAIDANSNIITPILYPCSKNPFPERRQVEYFDVDESIRKMDDDILELLCNIWGYNSELPAPSALLVCSSRWGVRVAKKGDDIFDAYCQNDVERAYTLLMQITLDYFLPPGFTPVIKWHPSFEIDDLQKALPGAIGINRLIDMAYWKFLCKRDNIFFEKMINFSWSAVKKIESKKILAENYLNLTSLKSSFPYANRFYVISNMIVDIFDEENKTICIAESCSPPFRYAHALKLMAQLFGIKSILKSTDNLTSEDGIVILCDPISQISNDFFYKLRNDFPNTTIFFPICGSMGMPDGVHINKLKDRFLLRCLKKALHDNSLLPQEGEVFGIYCHNSNDFEKLRLYKFKHSLKYAKAELTLSESQKMH
jgi:hypothetical protein